MSRGAGRCLACAFGADPTEDEEWPNLITNHNRHRARSVKTTVGAIVLLENKVCSRVEPAQSRCYLEDSAILDMDALGVTVLISVLLNVGR
jgi:hypothetical protein